MKQCYINKTNSFVSVLPIGDRLVYFDDELFDMNEYPLLDSDQQLTLDNLIDSFEDGGNELIEGYECLKRGKFMVKRKVKLV